MLKKKIYLDNGATTKVDPKVEKVMKKYFLDEYGNASSIHSFGRKAKEALENSRELIAKAIGAKSKEVYFTSGGTESNNWAIKGVAFAKENGHIITTKVEHKCVLNSCKGLEEKGFEISYLDVDEEGFVKLEELKENIKENTILVSVIHGNNEIGTINNLEEIGKICKEKNVLFHTDACQSFTKTNLDVGKYNLDLVTLNSHKIHGPKGVGALYIREGVEIVSWIHGGGQERDKRSGTENIPGIVGFAEAVKLAKKQHIKQMEKLRNKLIEKILKIPGSTLNGTRDKRLCNNVNVSFEKVEGEAIGGYLDQKGIISSTGSACSEKTLQPSYVLKALGRNNEMANGSLRLTLSRFTTEKEIDYVLEIIPEIIEKLRRYSAL
jgi:cysteine desulfurase